MFVCVCVLFIFLHVCAVPFGDNWLGTFLFLM